MPRFDPIRDAVSASPQLNSSPLPPTPSYKHDLLSSPSTQYAMITSTTPVAAPPDPPSPVRRNSVSMLLNDGPPPPKRQRTTSASLAHLLSPADSRPSSSGGPGSGSLQLDVGSPARSTISMGPPPLPRRSTPIPYTPRRITAGTRLKVPLTPEEEASMARSCRNTLRTNSNPANTAPTDSPRSRPSSSSGLDNKKRKRSTDDQHDPRAPPNGRDYSGDSRVVAQHYNQRREVGVKGRLESPIIGLRNFNNWIKSVLIAKFGRRSLHESATHSTYGRVRMSGKVLDLGCGKGGDLRKWHKANIKEYVGLDIAEVSIAQAEERHKDLPANTRFDAEFHAYDCFSGPLSNVVSPERLRTPFDVVSMQFCMHYAFESSQKVRTMLQNVSQYLRPGGVFLGTIPNSELLLSKLNQLPDDELSFGNSVYSIRFDNKREQPLYGHRYWFYLRDAVEDVPEYVVRWEEFKTLSLEYGLKAIHRSEFHDIFALERRDPEYGPLLQKMKVVNARGDSEMNEDQWHAANIYIAFAFEKE